MIYTSSIPNIGLIFVSIILRKTVLVAPISLFSIFMTVRFFQQGLGIQIEIQIKSGRHIYYYKYILICNKKKVIREII